MPLVPLGTGGDVRETSPFSAQLGMSWWRIFPSKQRENSLPLPIPASLPIHPHPLRSPPVIWATLVSSLGLSFCTQLMWRARSSPFKHHMEHSVFVTQLLET